MRAAIAVLLALTLGACGDDLTPADPDAGVEPDASPDAAVAPAMGPCLDRPDRLDSTPTGQLPCELVSPGFQP
ncbi:MAG: hypothetical protein JNL83_34680 [Myxococcales bacterium]|nr:hypothetical protein [Myxococcales bacterium]